MAEKNIRSVAKVTTWRVLATLTTAGLVYAFTGSFATALSVGSLEVVVKLLVYYGHERAWNAVSWGVVDE